MGVIAVLMLCCPFGYAQASEGCRDLTFFLRRLRTVEHLPEIEDSHTAMSSTWDRTGGNADGADFKRIEGDRNILLDVNGPGCIHRIFTGTLGKAVAGTRIRIILDDSPLPIFDREVNEFFDFQQGPLPYPLVFHKTYPGTLFPFPFAKHCRVELCNPQKNNWGNYWQVTYSIYPRETKVKTLQWPLNNHEKAELESVCAAWLSAESHAPPSPVSWNINEKLSIESGGTAKLDVEGCGVIREMRIAVEPRSPELLRDIRLCITWDDGSKPSVDVPLGYFFGQGDYDKKDKNAYFNSLLLGANEKEAYSRFPMPLQRKARFEFHNRGHKKVESLAVRLDIQKLPALPKNWGKFHATWTQEYIHGPFRDTMRRFPPFNVPVHVALERNEGPGKYVGVLLCLHWPHADWWGEGDWMIWTDENSWPPSYHGTGSEEYFNSGWCQFDRKAVSGVVRPGPDHVAVYSFHLNDAFHFRNNIRVAEEVWVEPHKYALWASTAYWYALIPQEARSRQDILPQLTEVKAFLHPELVQRITESAARNNRAVEDEVRNALETYFRGSDKADARSQNKGKRGRNAD
jgi:hypothetical protein